MRRMNWIAEQLTGWSEDEAKGKGLDEVFRIVNEETRRPVEDPVERVLLEGCVVGLANHTILIAEDGREIPIADSGAPIRDGQGAMTGVVLVFRDQTEERAARNTLRESEERFRAMFERHQAVMLTIEPETGAIVDGNEAAQRYYGYSRDELRNLNFRDIDPLAAYVDNHENQDPVGQNSHYDLPDRLSDGRTRWVEAIPPLSGARWDSFPAPLSSSSTMSPTVREPGTSRK